VVILNVEYLENYKDEWERLSLRHPGDSGFDLRCAMEHRCRLLPGQIVTLVAGIKIELPFGYEMQIRPRSGLSAKGLHVVFGTIDSGYRGEIMITLANINGEGYLVVAPGDRVAQGVIQKVHEVSIVEVGTVNPNTSRGSSGLGDSGVK